MTRLKGFAVVVLDLLAIAMTAGRLFAQEEVARGGGTHWSAYLSIVILIVACGTLWILLKSKFPKPRLLSGERSTSINVGHDEDGPYLQISLRLVNPGDVTIYGNDLWLESKDLFNKGDFLIHPTTQIIPPATATPRPGQIKYKAYLQRRMPFSCEEAVEVKIVFQFKAWIWSFSRKARFSHKIPPGVLQEIQIDTESD